MNKLGLIDLQIFELKKKKEQLKKTAAENLYKKLESMLGEEFSSEMVMGIIAAEWSPASPKQAKWQEQGATFFRQSSTKKTHKDSTKNHATRAEKNEGQ